jgi:L-threonylcarbamoyladenylate synthase
VTDASAALRTGLPVVLPTDTVYGLCGDPDRAEVAQEIARLNGRDERQPIALVTGGVEQLLDRVPELDANVLRALLPGAYTLVFPNPRRRYPWLTGARPDTIGVRVPELPSAAAEVLDEVGAVLATSANVHGGSDPRRLEDVPEEIRRACGALVDGGELPGTPSTVLDLTGPEPEVVREGAIPAADALAALADRLRE